SRLLPDPCRRGNEDSRRRFPARAKGDEAGWKLPPAIVRSSCAHPSAARPVHRRCGDPAAGGLLRQRRSAEHLLPGRLRVEPVPREREGRRHLGRHRGGRRGPRRHDHGSRRCGVRERRADRRVRGRGRRPRGERPRLRPVPDRRCRQWRRGGLVGARRGRHAPRAPRPEPVVAVCRRAGVRAGRIPRRPRHPRQRAR
ncbi:unnamed protein product, partial [Penicillium discolor]